jgi:hypothetical protein
MHTFQILSPYGEVLFDWLRHLTLYRWKVTGKTLKDSDLTSAGRTPVPTVTEIKLAHFVTKCNCFTKAYFSLKTSQFHDYENIYKNLHFPHKVS